MEETQMGCGCLVKEKLRSLCCSNGWSYGIFWSFDQRNSMLLRAEDAYYEEQMQTLVDDMVPQVHMLGEGIVGQTASTGKHQWIFSDANDAGWNSSANQNMFQDKSEIHPQFSRGIKTIAVIFVESQGVAQFGSSQKILERVEFLDETRGLFREMEKNGLTSSVNTSSSLNCENYDLNEWFATFCTGNIMPLHVSSCNELMEMVYTATNLPPDSIQEKMSPLCLDSSYPPDQLIAADVEAQARLSSKPGPLLQQVASQSAPSVNNLPGKPPCISGWSCESSSLTSLQSQFISELGCLNSAYTFSTKARKQNLQEDLTPTSCYSKGVLDQQNLGTLVSSQQSAVPIHVTEDEFPERKSSQVNIPEQFKPDDFVTDFSNSYPMDNLSVWFDPSLEFNVSEMPTIMNENLPQSVGVASVSSDLVGNGLANIPLEKPSNSVQSSITEADGSGGEKKYEIVKSAQDDLLQGLGLGFESRQDQSCWENMMMPLVNNLATTSGVSDSTSMINCGSMFTPRKPLFAELGLEELLDGVSCSNYTSKSSLDDQLSVSKKRRVESSSVSRNEVQLSSVSCSGSSTSMQTPSNLEKTDNLSSKKEGFLKSQLNSLIGESYIVNNGSTGQGKPKKAAEAMKTTRRRARPGESTRPRPKDRQQIQDRLKELKGIIPGGEKCSIDALLDRTIKHMLFLQSVTKYADKLKQANDPKLIGQESSIIKDNSTNGQGATWALEVGDQTAVCPIRIEDISPTGLMLIEMLCEDRGFFLELAEIIRGFGLNILKAMMEVQEDKLLARFIVEANTHMTRIEIFWSLVEIIQQTTSGLDSTNQPSKIMNDRISLLNTYQQPSFPPPIGLAGTLQ